MKRTNFDVIKDKYYQERPPGFDNPTDDFEAGFNEALKLVQKNALWFPYSRSILYLCSKIVEWLEADEDKKIELKWKEDT